MARLSLKSGEVGYTVANESVYWVPIMAAFESIESSTTWLATLPRQAPMAMAAISPEASLGQNGSPLVQSYSTARRGSIMVRKYTLPLEPPVAMTTALLALTFTVS